MKIWRKKKYNFANETKWLISIIIYHIVRRCYYGFKFASPSPLSVCIYINRVQNRDSCNSKLLRFSPFCIRQRSHWWICFCYFFSILFFKVTNQNHHHVERNKIQYCLFRFVFTVVRPDPVNHFTSSIILAHSVDWVFLIANYSHCLPLINIKELRKPRGKCCYAYADICTACLAVIVVVFMLLRLHSQMRPIFSFSFAIYLYAFARFIYKIFVFFSPFLILAGIIIFVQSFSLERSILT